MIRAAGGCCLSRRVSHEGVGALLAGLVRGRTLVPGVLGEVVVAPVGAFSPGSGCLGCLEAVLVEFEEVVGGGEQPPFGSNC